jgi:hypothetical protein
MSNCRADLSLTLSIINLSNRGDVADALEGMLSIDSDLRDNGPEYWDEGLTGTPHPDEDEDRDLCLCEELGYEDPVSMIVSEAMKGKTVKTAKGFEKVFREAFKGLTDQEFFGDCEFEIEELGDNKIALAYATGGFNKW